MSCREHGTGNYSANPSLPRDNQDESVLIQIVALYFVIARAFPIGTVITGTAAQVYWKLRRFVALIRIGKHCSPAAWPGLVLASVCTGSHNGNIAMVIVKAPAGAIVGFMVGREFGGEYCSPMEETLARTRRCRLQTERRF